MSKQLHVSSGANIEGGVATDAIDLKSVPTLPIVNGDIRIVNNNGVLSTTTDGVTFTALGAGTITTAAPLSGNGSAGTPATIAAGAVPLTALAAEAANTFVANGTGGTASPTAITAAAAAALLPLATPSAAGLMPAAIAAQFPLAGGGIPVTWTSAIIDLTAVTTNNIIGPRDPGGNLIGGGILAGYWFVPLGGSAALKFIGVTASGSNPAAGPTGNIGNKNTTRNNISASQAGIETTTRVE